MSKFLSYYNLFPIPDPKEFLGIAADGVDGNVVTTLARNVVVILNISTQKQLCSWSMPEKLSTKVIYDRASKKYVGVYGNHAVRLWDIETQDVAKCKKLKFQKSIAHVVPTADGESLVLYSDGKCETLSKALESRKDQEEDSVKQLELAASKTITKVMLHTLPEGHQMLTYFEEKHVTGEIELVSLTLATTHCRRYPLKREHVRITGYTIVEGDSTPQLFTIWSDKRIFMLSIGLGEHSEDRAPGQFVSMLAELNVESKLSVCGVSRNFVAIYGANYGQEGASLLVYNTQFKVVNAKQYFKVYLDFSRLWSCGEYILLAMGQNIAAVKYRMNQELLVDMLGSQFNDTHLAPIELDHINEEETLESAIKFGGSKVCTSAPKHSKLQTQPEKGCPLSDGKTIAFESTVAFNKELADLVKQHVHGDVVSVDNSLENINVTLMSNYFDTGPLNTVVQSIVRQLERSGAGEQEIAEKLLTLFIKTKSTDHVLMCLRRYTNISEQMLTLSLKYALELNQSNTDAMDVDGQAPSGDNQALLNAVLACTFEPNAIVPHLRQRLQLPQVRQLLKHLYVLLQTPDCNLEERPGYDDGTVARTELQALRWLGATLTSHFTTLTISKDAEDLSLLTQWSEILKDYSSSLSQIQTIVPMLINIVEKRKAKPKYDNMWYSIEEIVLY